MADIKQAGRWMKRGFEVFREAEPLEVFWASEHFDGAIHMSRCEGMGGFARMTVDQILAMDWQIKYRDGGTQ